MGLDMYAERKIYCKNRDHFEEDEKTKIVVEQKGKRVEDIDTSKISYVVEEAMYWRKANAIHQYFVDNVQAGNDDCGYYYVAWEVLEDLYKRVCAILDTAKIEEGEVVNGKIYKNGKREVCKEPGRNIINKEVAHKLLPTKEGFFFGNTDYDEWYIQDLEATREWLEKELKEKRGDIYYHSSW